MAGRVHARQALGGEIAAGIGGDAAAPPAAQKHASAPAPAADAGSTSAPAGAILSLATRRRPRPTSATGRTTTRTTSTTTATPVSATSKSSAGSAAASSAATDQPLQGRHDVQNKNYGDFFHLDKHCGKLVGVIQRLLRRTSGNRHIDRARQPVVYRPDRRSAGLADMMRGLFGAMTTALVEERGLACLHLKEWDNVTYGAGPAGAIWDCERTRVLFEQQQASGKTQVPELVLHDLSELDSNGSLAELVHAEHRHAVIDLYMGYPSNRHLNALRAMAGQPSVVHLQHCTLNLLMRPTDALLAFLDAEHPFASEAQSRPAGSNSRTTTSAQASAAPAPRMDLALFAFSRPAGRWARAETREQARELLGVELVSDADVGYLISVHVRFGGRWGDPVRTFDNETLVLLDCAFNLALRRALEERSKKRADESAQVLVGWNIASDDQARLLRLIRQYFATRAPPRCPGHRVAVVVRSVNYSTEDHIGHEAFLDARQNISTSSPAERASIERMWLDFFHLWHSDACVVVASGFAETPCRLSLRREAADGSMVVFRTGRGSAHPPARSFPACPAPKDDCDEG